MAAGIKIIARALYDRGGREEKDEAGHFFDALNVNGHGRIFLRDFQKSKVVEPRLLNDGVFKELSSNADGTRSFDDAEMMELQEIAKLHYEAASPEVQERAHKFFCCMDSDGDKKVGIEEFLSFMFNQGYDQHRNRRFFDELDADRSGALGFREVMTLYYIIKSGRPNCDLCKVFIPGVFFTGAECFAVGSTFRLCRNCYKKSRFNCHFHNGGTHFLDNYTLLHTIRESSLPRPRDDDDDDDDDDDRGWLDQPSSSSTTTVRASTKSQMSKMELAYKALELGIAVSTTVSNIAVTAGTIADFKCCIQ